MKVIDALNTHTPCLLALESLGFEIRLVPSDNDEHLGDWEAKRDGVTLVAEDPVRLLGLASMILVRGTTDWRSPGNGRRSELIDEAYPDNDSNEGSEVD